MLIERLIIRRKSLSLRPANHKFNRLERALRFTSYGKSVCSRRGSPQESTANRRERVTVQDPLRITRAAAGLEHYALRA